MLRFPVVPSLPEVYRLTLTEAVYVGEAAHLCRRMEHYRTPGPKQQANIRLNQHLLDHLVGGGTPTLETCTEASVVVNGKRRPADLDSKAERVLVEHAALVE